MQVWCTAYRISVGDRRAVDHVAVPEPVAAQAGEDEGDRSPAAAETGEAPAAEPSPLPPSLPPLFDLGEMPW